MTQLAGADVPSLLFRALHFSVGNVKKAKIISCPFSLKLEYLFVLFPAAKDLQAPLQLCPCSAGWCCPRQRQQRHRRRLTSLRMTDCLSAFPAWAVQGGAEHAAVLGEWQATDVNKSNSTQNSAAALPIYL